MTVQKMETALHQACDHGRIPTAELLLNHGADHAAIDYVTMSFE